MAIEYLLPVYLLGVLALHQGLTFHTTKKWIYYGIVLFMILLSGLRYKVGPDWPGYYGVYDILGEMTTFNLGELEKATGMEKGFVVFNYIFAGLGFPIWVFQIFFAGTAIYLKTSTIFKYCKFAFIGLMAYYIPLFFFEDIVQIRQGFATGIAIFSSRYIVDRNLKKFLIAIFIGQFFHTSILVFLPAYWLAKLNFSKIQMVIILTASLILANIEVMTILKPIVSLLPFEAVERGLSYTDTQYGASKSFGFADVSKVIFVLILIQYKDVAINKLPAIKFFINIFFFASVLYFTFRSDAIFAVRLTGYYTSFIYIVFPMLFYAIRDLKIDKHIVYFGFLIYLCLLMYRFIDLNAAPSFINYTNWLYNKYD